MPQKTFIEPGALSKLTEILSTHQAKKVFLVTGKNSYLESGAKDLLEPYLSKIETTRFCNFETNPRLEDANIGSTLIQNNPPDIVVSIGGGSVIDMAKLIVALAAHPNINNAELIKNSGSIKNKGTPLVAIPTTAGTGSEATHFAVAYINKTKYSLAHEYILPDYAIVDSRLSHKVPQYIAACSAMDALSQAVESYWSVNSNNESKGYAKEAIRLILPAIENAVLNSDCKAKEKMAKAAYLAGKAINITKTTAPHAISYPITSYFGLPHGHAVALSLGSFFIFNTNLSKNQLLDTRGEAYMKRTMTELIQLFKCNSAESCCKYWYSIMKTLNLETKLEAIGIKSTADKNLIIENVNLERLSNHPVRVSTDLINQLLQ